MYSKYGVARRETIAGKLAALNHVTHGFAIITPSSSARFKHNRFCAPAVRNKALELLAACQAKENIKMHNIPEEVYEHSPIMRRQKPI